jgi:hypothetical protein
MRHTRCRRQSFRHDADSFDAMRSHFENVNALAVFSFELNPPLLAFRFCFGRDQTAPRVLVCHLKRFTYHQVAKRRSVGASNSAFSSPNLNASASKTSMDDDDDFSLSKGASSSSSSSSASSFPSSSASLSFSSSASMKIASGTDIVSGAYSAAVVRQSQLRAPPPHSSFPTSKTPTATNPSIFATRKGRLLGSGIDAIASEKSSIDLVSDDDVDDEDLPLTESLKLSAQTVADFLPPKRDVFEDDDDEDVALLFGNSSRTRSVSSKFQSGDSEVADNMSCDPSCLHKEESGNVAAATHASSSSSSSAPSSSSLSTAATVNSKKAVEFEFYYQKSHVPIRLNAHIDIADWCWTGAEQTIPRAITSSVPIVISSEASSLSSLSGIRPSPPRVQSEMDAAAGKAGLFGGMGGGGNDVSSLKRTSGGGIASASAAKSKQSASNADDLDPIEHEEHPSIQKSRHQQQQHERLKPQHSSSSLSSAIAREEEQGTTDFRAHARLTDQQYAMDTGLNCRSDGGKVSPGESKYSAIDIDDGADIVLAVESPVKQRSSGSNGNAKPTAHPLSVSSGLSISARLKPPSQQWSSPPPLPPSSSVSASSSSYVSSFPTSSPPSSSSSASSAAVRNVAQSSSPQKIAGDRSVDLTKQDLAFVKKFVERNRPIVREFTNSELRRLGQSDAKVRNFDFEVKGAESDIRDEAMLLQIQLADIQIPKSSLSSAADANIRRSSSRRGGSGSAEFSGSVNGNADSNGSNHQKKNGGTSDAAAASIFGNTGKSDCSSKQDNSVESLSLAGQKSSKSASSAASSSSSSSSSARSSARIDQEPAAAQNESDDPSMAEALAASLAEADRERATHIERRFPHTRYRLHAIVHHKGRTAVRGHYVVRACALAITSHSS